KYPQLFWAGRGNQLLVFANRHSAIFDLDTQRTTPLAGTIPLVIGGSPQRADGAGFLVIRADKTVAFVDWNGKQTPIEIPADQVAGIHYSILSEPAVNCWTRWEGNEAVFTWKNGQLRLDTAKHVGSVRKPDEAEWAWDGKEIQN